MAEADLVERLQRVFDPAPRPAAESGSGVVALATYVLVSRELLDDARFLRRIAAMVLGGFVVARCHECGRRLRCVYALPGLLGWSDVRLYGSTCVRKVRARGFGSLYVGGEKIGTLTEPAVLRRA